MKNKLDKSYLRMAVEWGKNSYAKKLQVGCLIVKNQTIIADGYNGTPSGFPNVCEDANGKTFSYVQHAELNALAKLCKSTTSSVGATVYVSHRPCIACASLMLTAGITRVVYAFAHKTDEGPALLERAGVKVEHIKL